MCQCVGEVWQTFVLFFAFNNYVYTVLGLSERLENMFFIEGVVHYFFFFAEYYIFFTCVALGAT